MIGLDINVWRTNAGPRLGPELVPNGDFSQGSTGWQLGAGWSVTAGKLVATAAAQDTFTKTADGVPIVTAGRRYQIKIKCGPYTSGGWKVLLEGGANVFGDQAAAGDLATTLTAAVTGSLYIWANSLLTAAFDDVSVREILPPT